MVPKIVEYGMVIISGANENEAMLYGYVVLLKYFKLTTYLDELESVNPIDALEITK